MSKLKKLRDQKIKELHIASLKENLQNRSAGSPAIISDNLQLLFDAIEIDIKRLRDLPRGQERNKLKEILLANYSYEIKKIEIPSSLIVNFMIYAFDCSFIDEAITYFELAKKLSAPMPDNFKSSLDECFADNMFDWCKLKQYKKENFEPYFSNSFFKICQNDIIVCDNVKVKYYKLAINELEKIQDWNKILEYVEICENLLGDKAQVKTIKAKALKNLSPTG